MPVITNSTVLVGGGTSAASSVQYLDVGLTLEVEPTIYLDSDVAIKVNLEVSNIIKEVQVGGSDGSGSLAYQIGTRNANTTLRLKDGETQILAGLINDQDTQQLESRPGSRGHPDTRPLVRHEPRLRRQERDRLVHHAAHHPVAAAARGRHDGVLVRHGIERSQRPHGRRERGRRNRQWRPSKHRFQRRCRRLECSEHRARIRAGVRA